MAMRFGMAVLRLVIGALFMGHGLQKLAGWFGGQGLAGTADGFERIGLRPARAHAVAAGGSETVGGALLAVGALTPLATSVLSGTMAVAIDKVHARNGPWVTGGGYEYNLVLMAALFAIAAAGPGRLSVDARLGIGRSGAGIALAQLATALLAAGFVVRLGTAAGLGASEAGVERGETTAGS